MNTDSIKSLLETKIIYLRQNEIERKRQRWKETKRLVRKYIYLLFTLVLCFLQKNTKHLVDNIQHDTY